MEPLIIAATKNSPAVHFDPAAATFTVTGISIPEDAGAFYGPIITWLSTHMAELPGACTFAFDLQYFNSSSLKAIYLLLMEIRKGCTDDRQHTISWAVDEDDEFMNEAAETFSEMLGMDLTVVRKPRS